jgi:hypothetical protein
MDKKLKAVIVFYVVVFGSIYGHLFLQFFFEEISLLGRLFITGVLFIVFLLVIYLISSYLLGGWKPKQIGWSKEGFSESILWASALLLPLTFTALVVCYIMGIDNVKMWWDLGIEDPPLWIPLYGVLIWLIGGLMYFSLWQAFPIETLKEYPKKYILSMVSILFILLYNYPLVTSAFRPTDIIWLGIIFVAIYYKFRNSLALVLCYVFLFEGPVVWCFGVIFGDFFFLILLYIRALCSIAAIMFLIVKHYQKKNDEETS